MKKFMLMYLAAALSTLTLPAYSQDKKAKEDTTQALGLAGDNLDLYAVLDVFQKSKTIEEFEKSLNDESKKINNLDLNLDKKIDFIKVVTKKDGNSYQFVLRVDISKTESQDVAVILLDKDKDGKVSLQIVGDEELYGKDYVIEPKGNSSVTANPGYTGENPVTVNQTQTTVVVQQQPVVQYVYSPAYVPYVSPYYYGFYPGWWAFRTVVAVGMYRSFWYGGGCHGGYYGGHYGGGHNNVIINTGNRNNFNNYNNNKMRSTTVSDNRARGNYGNGAGADRRNGVSNSNRPSTSNRMNQGGVGGSGNRQSPSVSNNSRGTGSGSLGGGSSNRQSPSVSNNSRGTGSGSFGGSSNRGGGSYGGGSFGGGGGRSMGGGGGRSMGGGGGRRR